jgi:hypothetical protein
MSRDLKLTLSKVTPHRNRNKPCFHSPFTCLLYPFQTMSNKPAPMDSFLSAKAEFLKKARNAKSTNGIVDGGQEMEMELVSKRLF